jgi:DNA helicase II / ATP-dependent DNA helicase PcrA
MLDNDQEFADVLRWRFRHLLVDEAQDLNPLQHRLVDRLRQGHDDLFLVGDPAQAIYGFNGADPSLLVDVADRFPGIEIVRLRTNHRCTPQVVDAGVHVLTTGSAMHGEGTRPGFGPPLEPTRRPEAFASSHAPTMPTKPAGSPTLRRGRTRV